MHWQSVSGNLNERLHNRKTLTSMKNDFTIFYSWQSDIKRNSNFIHTCIEKAIKNVINKQDKSITLEINIDRDTRNKSGSPSIANTIFKKIALSNLFICDVTVVNKNLVGKLFKTRTSPNPNVLIELGYAVRILGWERIVCICDTQINSLEELPFDIRGHRITTFQGAEQSSKQALIGVLTTAIESIIINYDKIVAEQSKSNNNIYDINIFHRMNEICSESKLRDSISVVVNSLFTDKHYLHIWDKLQEFYKLTTNKFINKELDDLALVFLQNLNDFDTIITTKFHMDDKQNSTYQRYLSMKANGETLTEEQEFEYEQSQTYSPHKNPFRNETWEDADKRIYRLQEQLYEQGEKVKLSYRELVMKIKQILM